MDAAAQIRRDLHGSQLVYQFDGGTGIVDSKTQSRKRPLIDPGVQIVKTVAEFQLLIIDGDGAVGALFIKFQEHILSLKREVPLHIRPRKFQKAAHTVLFPQAEFDGIRLAEQPQLKIKKVYTDIGSNPARLN